MTQTKPCVSFLAVICLFSLLLSCAPQNPVAGVEALKEVNFLDSSSFDRKLSASLSANQPQVDVVFPATITLNNIPERMDKWLSKVEKFGGKVEIQAEPELGRELFSTIFSLFVKAYEVIEETVIYSPAKKYNVMVYYKAKTGIVTKMAFVRKADLPAANAVAGSGAASGSGAATASSK